VLAAQAKQKRSRRLRACVATLNPNLTSSLSPGNRTIRYDTIDDLHWKTDSKLPV